jgi:hypothetical protein
VADEIVFDGAQFDIQYLRSLHIDHAMFGQSWEEAMPEHLGHLMAHMTVTFIPRTPGISSSQLREQASG